MAKSDNRSDNKTESMLGAEDDTAEVRAEPAKGGKSAVAVPPEQITYRPGPEDPPSTTWMRHVFHANIPKDVTNADLIEKAKKNRFFHVGKFNPAVDGVPVAEQSPAPKTAEQYRAHAIAWLKKCHSVDELDTKWIAEESLRASCGVGTDDLDYLGDIFRPTRAELQKRDFPT